MDISRQSQDRIEDLIWLGELGVVTTKILRNLKNPYLFKHFLMSGGVGISIPDYAYAAGLISRAEADYLNHPPIENDDNENDEDDGNVGGVL